MAVAPDASPDALGDLESHFTPLLSQMVHAGVLERDDSGRWVLASAPQRWLDARAARPRPPTAARVAVGLRCQGCGESGLTTMADSRRLCPRCKATGGYVDADPVPLLRARRAP